MPHQKEESACLAFEMFTLYSSQLLFNTFNSAVFWSFIFLKFCSDQKRPAWLCWVSWSYLGHILYDHTYHVIAAVALPRRDGLSSPDFISRLPHNSISLVAHRWRNRRCCSVLVVQDQETSKNETRSCVWVTDIFRRRTQLGELHHVLLEPQNYPDYLLRVCHFLSCLFIISVPETLAVYKDGQSPWFQRGGQRGSAEDIISIVWLARQK